MSMLLRSMHSYVQANKGLPTSCIHIYAVIVYTNRITLAQGHDCSHVLMRAVKCSD